MIYLILIAAIVTLALLYKFSPTKKTFMIICAGLLIVFLASAFIREQQQQEKLSRAQLEELQEQQKIFGEWYAAYQKDIDRLDRNWQSYHNIIEGLNTVDAQSFNAEALYTRLLDLEFDSVEEQLKIHMLAAPQGFNGETRDLIEELIRKTQHYVDAQTRTISLSKVAATPPVELEILKLKLHDIMIRESPEGLFTAQEVSAIRSALGD
ncbi:MAG: hypothetical protein IKZ53_01030 [Selenomonadaceae bacterium]|nr:hypothetical protein [Selenomonadaceae bacterium]